eukprot:621896-Rhodomonas_salina.1
MEAGRSRISLSPGRLWEGCCTLTEPQLPLPRAPLGCTPAPNLDSSLSMRHSEAVAREVGKNARAGADGGIPDGSSLHACQVD